MASNISLAWGGSQTQVTWSAGAFPVSLANATDSAASDVIDLTAQTPILDVFFNMKMRTQTLTTGGAVQLYGLASLDNSNFTNVYFGEYTLIGSMSLAAASVSEYSAAFSLARAFGGVLPPFLKLVVRNETSGTLSATTNDSNVWWRKVYATQT